MEVPDRALHNLSPKSARILSAAITRTTLPPAGVRIEPPAGVRIPRDDFHSLPLKRSKVRLG